MSQQTAQYLLKQLQKGEINPDEYEFDITKDLTIDQQLLLLFEIRFKQHLKQIALKLQSSLEKTGDPMKSLLEDC